MQSPSLYTGTQHLEAKLLLCCARTRVDEENSARIRALVGGKLDWGFVLSLADNHGVMPLLYRNLAAHCWETVPKTLQDRLRDHFSLNAQRNLILTSELLKLLNLFQTQEIPAIPFRGPSLAAAVYGDVGLRQFGDLDILVHKRDVLQVKDLLFSCGYRPLFPLPSREEAIFLRCEYPFTLGNGKLFLDLHWGMEQAYFARGADSEPLWDRLEQVILEGRSISTLSRSDLFVHLCMHGAKHYWARLDWICDLAELIPALKEAEWRWIMERAAVLGSKRMTCLGVFLANRLLGTAIPEEVEHTVSIDKKVSGLAEQVCSRLFSQANNQTLTAEDVTFYLRTMDRLADRIRYCLTRLINPTPWSVEKYSLPSSVFFLHYLLRPLQLVRHYGSKQRYDGRLTR